MAYASVASLRLFFVDWPAGALAGLAGGATEIAWIVLYERLAGGEAAAVARAVAHTLFPSVAAFPAALLGIAIHLVLAVGLGVAIVVLLAAVLPRASGTALGFFAVVGLLIAAWMGNFFLVLPGVNPAFVTIVPLAVSLTSKLLFGIAAAAVLHFRSKHRLLIGKAEGGIACHRN
jgi:hypothetical protein